MENKRFEACSKSGHEWELCSLENYRSKSSLSQHLKRCIKCGRKQVAYSPGSPGVFLLLLNKK